MLASIAQNELARAEETFTWTLLIERYERSWDHSHYAVHARTNETSAEDVKCVPDITDSVTGNRLEALCRTHPSEEHSEGRVL